MAKIGVKLLGGAKKVGRVGILVNYDSESLLLDYGSEPSNEFKMPEIFDTRNLKGVVLSHAHIDHSGAIPYIYKAITKPPLIATPPTIDLSILLIRDMMKILKYNVPFTEIELNEMIYRAVPLKYEREIKLGENFLITLHDAGHIPGSSSIEVNIDGTKIWYTGDFNIRETRLHWPAKIVEDADIVILEATYSYKDHPRRIDEEKRLVSRLNEILEEKGTVLIPAFSVGRAQEILSVLQYHDFKGTIAIDGMAKEATEIILRYSDYIKDSHLLERAVKRVKWIKSKSARRKLLKKPSVIIAPAGMLGGGWADWYMKQLAFSERNGIFLVSFQVEGTTGYRLLNEKKIQFNGKVVEVKAQVEQFDFSAHNGRGELIDILKKMHNPQKIILIHGEEKHLNDFVEEVSNEGINVEVGVEGRVYTF